MFGGFGNRAAAYAKVGVETGVNTADPHKLILMLFEGALLQIGTAAIAMDSKDIPTKGKSISKAIDIIMNGLKVSLDIEAGGELAERLDALYEYMADRLLQSGLRTAWLAAVLGAVRYIVSMERADRQITYVVLVLIGIGVLILVLVTLSGTPALIAVDGFWPWGSAEKRSKFSVMLCPLEIQGLR